jgi:hypothetical protein
MSKSDRFRRRRTPTRARQIDTRELRESFLIVCEGEATEPNYFNKFRLNKLVVRGTGHNTASLVRKAIQLRNERQERGEAFDQVWCVFDKDSFSTQSFNQALALALARREQLEVAYSNEAFELWYLLHFAYHDSAMARNLYCNRLTAALGVQYQKNSEDMYDRLLNKQQDAIRNAERLLSQYDPPDPWNDNPSTTVHLLVKELIKNSS